MSDISRMYASRTVKGLQSYVNIIDIFYNQFFLFFLLAPFFLPFSFFNETRLKLTCRIFKQQIPKKIKGKKQEKVNDNKYKVLIKSVVNKFRS
jgi:hypothetical protein